MRTTMDFRTTKQRERAVRDARIAEQFTAIRAKHPEVAETRIMAVMAEEGKYYTSLSGIRQSLKRSKTI